MPFDAQQNPLQAWLRQRHAHHPDFRYLKIQCQDEQGLFWHKRHLYLHTPNKVLKAKFVKRIDYKHIAHIHIARIDGHLAPPWLLYPQPLRDGLLFASVGILLVMLMVYLLRYLPDSSTFWLYPVLLSMVFFSIHEQWLQTLLTWKQASLPTNAALLHPPRWLKWLLRLALFALLFMGIGIPITIWLQTLERTAWMTVMGYSMVYLIIISVADTWLKHRLRQRHPIQAAHYFVLQLDLVDGHRIDFAYAQDESVLQPLKQHLYQQSPCLQDAYVETQS